MTWTSFILRLSEGDSSLIWICSSLGGGLRDMTIWLSRVHFEYEFLFRLLAYAWTPCHCSLCEWCDGDGWGRRPSSGVWLPHFPLEPWGIIWCFLLKLLHGDLWVFLCCETMSMRIGYGSTLQSTRETVSRTELSFYHANCKFYWIQSILTTRKWKCWCYTRL